jgi:prophage antirepressor-like protein
LILSSKLPQAKAFKRWVTSEVLPQIRRTGGYIPTHDAEGRQLSDEEILMLAERSEVGAVD